MKPYLLQAAVRSGHGSQLDVFRQEPPGRPLWLATRTSSTPHRRPDSEAEVGTPDIATEVLAALKDHCVGELLEQTCRINLQIRKIQPKISFAITSLILWISLIIL
jgi:phosphoglycerate dehydrogenase-like enzyme